MEKLLWKTIRDKLPKYFIQRIETQIERGIPDVHYTVDGVSGWIEGKYIDTPKRQNTKLKVKLSVEQIAWHKAYKHYGGLVYILVKKNREIYLFDGSDGEELAKGVTRERFQELSLANKWIEIDKILSSKIKK
tara:strand:- start:436 stop:834 length:399 start_codon:yes stop_codon:yes gene_type:complete